MQPLRVDSTEGNLLGPDPSRVDALGIATSTVHNMHSVRGVVIVLRDLAARRVVTVAARHRIGAFVSTTVENIVGCGRVSE